MMEENSRSHNQEKVRHTGGCHCGAVRFEVWAPATLDVIECKLVRELLINLVMPPKYFLIFQLQYMLHET